MIFPAEIILRPIIPVFLLVPVLFVVGLLTWHTYRQCALNLRQRIGLCSCRILSLLIIAWLLFQGERRKVSTTRENPVLAVALDVSASMMERPDPSQAARAERALKFFDDRKTRRVCDRYRVFRYEIGSELEEGTEVLGAVRFNAPRSHIGSAINEIAGKLGAENLAGIILLSDGLDHSGEKLAPQALATPIFVPELEAPPGEDLPEKADDTWVDEISYPKMMVVNWKGSVDALIRRDGDRAVSFPIHFRQGERLLRTAMVEFAEGEHFKQVSFNVEPLQKGQIMYEVAVDAGQDADTENNSRSFVIEVTDPKNRILYLEGTPRWEFKFLKRALISERNFQLAAYVRGGDGSFINFDEIAGRAGGGSPEFTLEALRDYKLIILGDLSASALSEDDYRNIRDFVDRGGGLFFLGAAGAYGAGGIQAAPYLEELVPAVTQPGASMKEGRFSVDLTAAGRAHPATRSLPQEVIMPPLLSFWSPVEVGEFSSTLVAVADGSPVLVVRRYGQGRAAMLLSDSLWRWQLGALDRGGAQKSIYNQFITQLIHWLTPSEKEVEKGAALQALVADSEVEMRESVTIGAIYEAGDAEMVLNCRITTPAGKAFSLPMTYSELGKDVGLGKTVRGYRCLFSPQQAGKYEVLVSLPDGTQETGLFLLAARAEHEKTGALINRDYLEQLARNTGGAFVPISEHGEMFGDIPYEPKDVQLIEEYPIWNKWWWLMVLVMLFTFEWWWRRKLDLV